MTTSSQAVAVLLIALLLVSGIGLSDADGDGLGNHKEWFGPTGWLTADTDDDGLSDGEERELGSDPTAGDTSGDRIADGIAAEYELDPSERYPSTLVSALVMAHQRYPDSAERLVNAVYHSGPTPGELTAFEKRQLRLWMDAPSDYQDAIISKRYFHKDDWDKGDGGLAELGPLLTVSTNSSKSTTWPPTTIRTGHGPRQFVVSNGRWTSRASLPTSSTTSGCLIGR
jgi:hypothetical protein